MVGQPTILLVDDDTTITSQLTSFLEASGYHTIAVNQGEAALAYVRRYSADLIVLDVLMPPGISGYEVLQQLRDEQHSVLVILISQYDIARQASHVESQVLVDDYLRKPFSARELVARSQALLQRRTTYGRRYDVSPRLFSGNLELNRSSRQAWLGGRELCLSRKALEVLAYLMAHPGETLSYERLLNNIWFTSDTSDRRSMLVSCVAEVFCELEEDPAAPRFILPISEYGYRFVPEVTVLDQLVTADLISGAEVIG